MIIHFHVAFPFLVSLFSFSLSFEVVFTLSRVHFKYFTFFVLYGDKSGDVFHWFLQNILFKNCEAINCTEFITTIVTQKPSLFFIRFFSDKVAQVDMTKKFPGISFVPEAYRLLLKSYFVFQNQSIAWLRVGYDRKPIREVVKWRLQHGLAGCWSPTRGCCSS